ncbi:hypothetical protein BJ165DRAFT_1485237 [Panaeolus papilionaceus]|nr:hypothetical protein BJ165DRAFT_1485237 [Panaeolus papilionaceus]
MLTLVTLTCERVCLNLGFHWHWQCSRGYWIHLVVMITFPSKAHRECCDVIRDHFSQALQGRIYGRLFYARDYNPIPQCPLWLTDRHLAPALTLQRVVHVENMLTNLETQYEDAFTRYLTNGDIFPSIDDRLPPALGTGVDLIGSPASFASSYQHEVGKLCHEYASKLLVHPDQPFWHSILDMEPHQRYPLFHHEANLFLVADRSQPGDFKLGLDKAKCLNPSLVAKLQLLRDSHETLAIFNFIPPSPTSDYSYILLDFRRSFRKERHWVCASTLGFRSSSRQIVPTPDSPQAWWSQYTEICSTSASSTKEKSTKRSRKRVWIPPRSGIRSLEYEPYAPHFLQRAWCRAVENDATFIVFNCGNGEKIGIRHRASNTLFISPRLDPFNTPYTSVHMALHWAILKDALERTPQPQSLSTPVAGQKRRRNADTNLHATRASKRLRGEKPSEDTAHHLFNVDREISSRNILLVSFDFGPFNSPAPSSFLRTSPSCHPEFISRPFPKVNANRTYDASKCLDFVAREKLGRGRVGTCYRGVLRMQTPDGNIMEEQVVLKIPLGLQPAECIHDEYAIYEKLREDGVTSGILKVHGVFEDVETGSVALLMQDGGADILHRECIRTGQRSPPQMSLSTQEYETLLAIVKGINAAGVLHNDIKPANIVVNQQGTIFIIDFDMGLISPELKHEFAGHSNRASTSQDTLTIRDLYLKTYEQGKRYF